LGDVKVVFGALWNFESLVGSGWCAEKSLAAGSETNIFAAASSTFLGVWLPQVFGSSLIYHTTRINVELLLQIRSLTRDLLLALARGPGIVARESQTLLLLLLVIYSP
jgi:hypothetical protein